jgi:hypothetical protein
MRKPAAMRFWWKTGTVSILEPSARVELASSPMRTLPSTPVDKDEAVDFATAGARRREQEVSV